MKNILNFFIQLFKNWSNDNSPMLAAALSFYTFFSLPPLLILIINLVGAIFGHQVVQGAVMEQINNLIGKGGAQMILGMMSSAQHPSKGAISSIISAVTLLVGAVAIFAQLQIALNFIWKAPGISRKGVWGFLRKYILSFGLIVTIGFLLLVSLVISTAMGAVNKYFSQLIPDMKIILSLLNELLSFVIITILFALTFKVLPNVKVTWRVALTGAAFTSILFIIGKYLIGLYLGSGNMGNNYGAAASLVIILLWVYYSSQILLFGAEFTKQIGEHRKNA